MYSNWAFCCFGQQYEAPTTTQEAVEVSVVPLCSLHENTWSQHMKAASKEPLKPAHGREAAHNLQQEGETAAEQRGQRAWKKKHRLEQDTASQGENWRDKSFTLQARELFPVLGGAFPTPVYNSYSRKGEDETSVRS